LQAIPARAAPGYDLAMRLSTRNQLKGTITEVDLGAVMAIVKVKLDGGDQIVTSSVTKDAATDLGLQVGQSATVFIKSTEVTIGVE
jgi:molybdopterin-binding protein